MAHFSSRPQIGILETGISSINRFIRAPFSGSSSNAPLLTLSVPHIDVNADGGIAKQARSTRNFVFLTVLSSYLSGRHVWRG